MVHECRRMSNLSMTVTIWVGTNLPEFIILNNVQNKKNSGTNCSMELTHMHCCCFCSLGPSTETSPRTSVPENLNLNCKRIIHTDGEVWMRCWK